jgi:hypothetical protein
MLALFQASMWWLGSSLLIAFDQTGGAAGGSLPYDSGMSGNARTETRRLGRSRALPGRISGDVCRCRCGFHGIETVFSDVRVSQKKTL